MSPPSTGCDGEGGQNPQVRPVHTPGASPSLGVPLAPFDSSWRENTKLHVRRSLCGLEHVHVRIYCITELYIYYSKTLGYILCDSIVIHVESAVFDFWNIPFILH